MDARRDFVHAHERIRGWLCREVPQKELSTLHLQHAPRPTVRESAKARGRRARGDRQGVPSLRGSKDIPQFAPNFSVYLLPPDAVCLYSEDRKFFLHGELYCALASAIGNGGRSFRDLFGELERKYPSDKIQEAFKRLLDRRFLVADIAPPPRDSSRLLGELGPAAGNGAEEPSELSCEH